MRVNPIDPIYKLIKENSGLIGRCLRGVKVPDYCEFEDLEQVGRIALMKAAQKYDPNKGCKFSTYAYYYIKGNITRTIHENVSILSQKGLYRMASKNYDVKLPVVTPLIMDETEDDYNPKAIPSVDNSKVLDVALDCYKLKRLYDKYFYVLTPKQKEAIEIFYFKLRDDGRAYKMKDIAEELNTSTSAISTRIRLGCQTLKKKIGNYLDVYI